MSLPHALLGLINYKPATGYKLKATFKESIHFFWNATLPQIYRTLNEMETKGWLTSTVEHQDGKPSRKVYQVTEWGRAEFLRWLAEPAEEMPPRHSLMIKVFFGNQFATDHLAQHLKQWRDYHAGLLEKYETEVMPIIEHYAALSGATDDAFYWKLTLDYGKRQARMTVEWCDEVLKQLDRAQKTEKR